MQLKPRKRNVLRGIRIFAAFTVLGIAVVFYITGSQKTWMALKKFDARYFLIACGLILVDLFSGALRIHIFTRRILKKNSFRAAFNANLANIFLAAATPFQTGGGVAQLFVLNRYGLPYAAGVTVSVLNFVATLSMLFVAASIILTAFPHRFQVGPSLYLVMDFSRLAFYFTLFFFIIFMVRPFWVARIARRITAFVGRLLKKNSQKVELLANRLLDFVHQYRGYMKFYWKEEKMILVWNYVLTLILYFNKCLVAYVIFRGLGLTPAFWDVIMLQMLIVFFLYFAPTPGASFVAETSTTAIMSLLAPGYMLALFTVLWRFFTTYFGVVLGSFVLIRAIQAEKVPVSVDMSTVDAG